MAVTVTLSGNFAVTNGQTFTGTGTISDGTGLAMVRNETITHPATNQVVDVGAGDTDNIKSLFISTTAGCTIKINNSSTTCDLVAGDFILMKGAACKAFLDGLSGGTTFTHMKVTTAATTILNIAVVFAAEA